MENTNRVILENNDKYNIDFAESGEAFISSMETDLLTGNDDMVSIRTKPLPPPKLNSKTKKIKQKISSDQTFWTKFMPKLFGKNKIKPTDAQIDTATLNIKPGAKNPQQQIKKEDNDSYLHNLKQYDPPEKIAENKDDYQATKNQAQTGQQSISYNTDDIYGSPPVPTSNNSVTFSAAATQSDYAFNGDANKLLFDILEKNGFNPYVDIIKFANAGDWTGLADYLSQCAAKLRAVNPYRPGASGYNDYIIAAGYFDAYAKICRDKPGDLVLSGFLIDRTIPEVPIPIDPEVNHPPTANAGQNQSVNLDNGNSVTLNGSGYDPDGDDLTYSWEQISGPDCTMSDSSNPTLNLSDLQSGTYRFRLTVTDSNGASHSSVVTVNASHPPEVFAMDVHVGLSNGNSTLLEGIGWDADNDPLTYRWMQNNGPNFADIVNPNSSSTNINNLEAGTYTFTLTATDKNGFSTSCTVTVTVTEQSAPPDTPPPPQYPPIDLDMLGTIINDQVTEDLISLSNDEDFYEIFYAYVIDFEKCPNLSIHPDYQALLEKALMEGDKVKFDEAINTILAELKNLPPYTITNENLIRLTYTISLLNAWKQVGLDTIKQSFFKPVKTPFLIMRTDKFDELKNRVLLQANVQKLLTMLTQAKGDSYNLVLQILTEQSGYQKMNIEKLNDKQTNSVTNYVNKRMTELSSFVNGHNKLEENKLKAEINENRKKEHTNFFSMIISGISAFLAVVLFGVAGVSFAPVVLGLANTFIQVVQNIRTNRIETTALRQEMEIEEQLMLLHAAQKQMDASALRKKIAELRQHQQEAEEKQIEREQLEQQLKTNIETRKAEIKELEEALTETPDDELLQDQMELLKTDLVNLQNELKTTQDQISDTQKYLDILDLEQMQSNITAQNSALKENSGYMEFDAALYTQNALRVQALINALRIFEMIQKAEHQGRNNIAAELSLPGTAVSNHAENIINNKAVGLIEKMNEFGQREVQLANAFNQRKDIQERISQLNLNVAFQTVSSLFFGILNVATFGTGGTVLQSIFSSTGEAAFGLFGKSKALERATFNPNKPTDFSNSQSSADFYAIYNDILSGSGDMLRNLTENKKTLDYEKYLQLIESLKFAQIQRDVEIAIDEAEKNSRNIVHQEMTDIKNSTQGTMVKIVSRQDFALLQDIIQKQAYLANIQAQAINRRVDMETDVKKAGYNIIASFFGGLLAGQSKINATNKNDEFIAGQINSLFSNNKDNIFNLIINDSDLKLQAENNNSQSGGLSSGLSDFKSNDLFVEDERGNVTVDQRVLLKKYAKLQKQLLLDQALSALQSARQKVRDIIHMELTQKTAPATNLTSAITTINQETALQEWNILTEQVYSIADLQTQRNFANTDLQRTFMSSLYSTAFASLGFAAGMNVDQANAVGKLAQISSDVIYLLQDINDTTLDAVNRLTSEDLTNSDLAEELGFNRLTEAEKNLLLEAMNYKNNIGEYGFAVEDKGHLEYIHTLLDRLQETKEMLAKIQAELSEERSNVHSVLNAAAAESNSILKDFANMHKQFVQQIMDSLKKGASEIIKRQNERQNQRLQLELQCFDYVISALKITAPFLNDSSNVWLTNFAEALNSFVPLLKAAYLEYFKKGEEEKQAMQNLDGLTAEEKARVQSAYAAADLALSEAEKSYGFLEQTNKLVLQSIQEISKLTAQAITKNIMDDRLNSLLNDNRPRKEIADYEKQLESLKLYIAWLELDFPKTHPLYNTQIKPALELCQVGDYAGALAILKFDGLNEEMVGEDAFALKDCLTQIVELDEKVAIAKAELAQAESGALNNAQDFRANLDYIQENIQGFTELQKKVGDKEMTVEEFQATEEYQNMRKAALGLAPLFHNTARYEKLIQELIPLAAFYGTSVEYLLNGLTNAQDMYINFEPDYETQTVNTESLQKQILAKDNYFYTPASDMENAWGNFFARQHARKAAREKIEKQNKKIDDSVREAFTQAQHDRQVLQGLFDNASPEEEIDIATADISQELKLYIISICGGFNIPPARRNDITNYVNVRTNNREMLLLNTETDIEFATMLLDSDWNDLESLQQKYNSDLQEYLMAMQTQDTATQASLRHELDRQRASLDYLETAFSEKKKRFTELKARNFRLQ